jgi:hypothetical protein
VSSATRDRSGKHNQDAAQMWRLEAERLTLKCQDLERDRDHYKGQYDELARDYRHALNRLWDSDRRQ